MWKKERFRFCCCLPGLWIWNQGVLYAYPRATTKRRKGKKDIEHARSVSQNPDDDIKKHQARRAEILAQKEAQEKEKSISESLTDKETFDLEKFKYDREQLRKRSIEQNRIEAARKQQALIIKKLKKEYNDYKLLFIVFVLCGMGLIIFMAVLEYLYAPTAILSTIMLLIGFLHLSIMDEKKKTQKLQKEALLNMQIY